MPFAVVIFPAVDGITDHVYVPLLIRAGGIEYVMLPFKQAIGPLGVITAVLFKRIETLLASKFAIAKSIKVPASINPDTIEIELLLVVKSVFVP